MKEKKFELLAKIKQVSKNLSLVISMKEKNKILCNPSTREVV